MQPALLYAKGFRPLHESIQVRRSRPKLYNNKSPLIVFPKITGAINKINITIMQRSRSFIKVVTKRILQLVNYKRI